MRQQKVRVNTLPFPKMAKMVLCRCATNEDLQKIAADFWYLFDLSGNDRCDLPCCRKSIQNK